MFVSRGFAAKTLHFEICKQNKIKVQTLLTLTYLTIVGQISDDHKYIQLKALAIINFPDKPRTTRRAEKVSKCISVYLFTRIQSLYN